MSYNSHINIEQPIARRLVSNALLKGYTVSVNDGEEWTVKRSTHKPTIVGAMFSTDSDTLRFRRSDGSPVGSVILIYGNGEDVIADYSANPDIEHLVESTI